MPNNEYAVNWKNHTCHIRQALSNSFAINELTDVTLLCDNKKIRAHKIILSACSTYFKNVFKEMPSEQTAVVLYGVQYKILTHILHFIYNGEASVENANLDSFLQLGRFLQVDGLVDTPLTNVNSQETVNPEAPVSVEQQPESSSKRQVKRQIPDRTDEIEVKSRRQNEDLLISDIKCEPSEVAGYIEPIETDPLFHGEQSQEMENVYDEGVTFGDEDIKTQGASTKNSWPIHTIKCKVCNKIFSHPYSLQQHKPVHAGNTRCPICCAVLSRKYHLKLHMKARHNIK